MPAPLFALVGKLALGFEFVLQPVAPRADIGLDRVIVNRAQHQRQLDLVQFELVDLARWVRFDQPWLLLRKLSADGSRVSNAESKVIAASGFVRGRITGFRDFWPNWHRSPCASRATDTG